MIVSAQLAVRSQWCAAHRCPADAEPSGLCSAHERQLAAGQPIQLHHTQQPATPNPDTHLPCYGPCQRSLPDNAFPHWKYGTKRRGRHNECRDCAAARRNATRNGPNGALIRAREAATRRRYRQTHP